MKPGKVEKQMTAITTEDLTKINAYARREHTEAELYAFPLVLCDNEVDRDNERFSIKALHKLAEVFLGRTGIFDHRPTATGQTARIYHTEVVADNSCKTSVGEPYTQLTARAYMLRDEETAATIRSIDAGILKEISVGCAVSQVLCSVCGANQRERPCEHKDAHRVLEDPTDAYEWSFVAVPAQPAAGVTKTYIHPPQNDERDDQIAALLAERNHIMKQLELEE